MWNMESNMILIVLMEFAYTLEIEDDEFDISISL